MTEWEQIKKEYREIPVPANGPHQILQTIAEAKRKRNRIKHVAKYGTVAAAVLLVLLLPGTLLFSGGFGANSENMSMEADCAAESATEGGWFAKGTANDSDTAPVANSAVAPETTANDMTSVSGNSMEKEEASRYSYSADDMLADANQAVTEKKESLWSENREAISEEILRQMKERMLMNGETYYCKSEEYPEGFERISEEQEYYINEEGLLVIVFAAGVVAPEKQGTVEFVIPAEVLLP